MRFLSDCKYLLIRRIGIRILLMIFVLLACEEKTFRSYYDDGIMYYKNFRYERSINQFKKSIKLNINNEEAYKKITAAYKEANLANDGINYFEELIKKNPENEYLPYWQGILLLDQKDLIRAIQKFKTSILLNPQFASPYTMLVETCKEIDTLDLAVQHFLAMIEKQPQNPFIHYGLAYAYRKHFLPDQAFKEIEQALILQPSQKDFLYLKAKLFTDIGDYDNSIATADSGLKILEEDDYDFEDKFRICKSINYWYKGDNNIALKHLSKVLKTSRHSANIDHELQALNLMGLVYRSTDRPFDALDIYYQALKIARKRGFNGDDGIFLGNLGDIYLTIAQYDSALFYLKASQVKLEEVKDIKNLAATFSSIAYAYSSQAEYDKALEYGEKAMKICQEVGDIYGEITELINFGVIHVELGNYFNALKFLNKALLLSRDRGQKYNEQLCLANIGEIYFNLGNYNSAREYLESSNEIAKEVGSKGEVAANNASLGTIYLAIGDTNKALQYLEQALKIFIEISDKTNEATTCSNIAIILSEQKKYIRAEKFFERALRTNQEISNKYGESNTLVDYGNLHLALNDYTEAIKLYRKALNIGKDLKIKEVIAAANYGLGQSLLKQKKFIKAVDYYKSAITALENIRSLLRISEFKSGFLERKINIYHELIDLYFNLYQESGGAEYIKNSFEYAERAKARALLDILAESRINIHKGVDSLLLSREKKIQRTIANLQTQLSTTELLKKQKDELYEKINQSEQQFNDLQFEIKQKNPAYSNLQYPEPMSVSDIQKIVLDEDQVMLEYSLSEKNSYLWIITKDEADIFQLLPEKQIRKKVEEYLFTVASSPRAGISPDIPGKELYNLLLTPADQQLRRFKRIIIIPDGILHYLPFEALISGVENNLPHYFIESFVISYAPSASVYEFIKEKRHTKETAKRNDLIAFADPVYERTEKENMAVSLLEGDRETLRGMYKQGGFSFERLRYSADEVNRIASHFPEDEVSLFLRENAKEEKIKSGILAKYKTIHFATHAIIDEKLPGRSSIVLTLDDDPTEDGFLRVNEILNLKLEAELVTLSACQTGHGKLVRGEGIIGLTRAFLYAGASSLLVSHWPVSDYSTAQFMDKFYGYLQQGKSKSEALRKAKLDFIRSEIPKNRHPYYWAAFVLTGKD